MSGSCKEGVCKFEKIELLEKKGRRKWERTCCGNSLKDWGLVFLIIAVLYVCLGLIYAGFLSLAIEIRDERWLELPNRHFGPFSKVERALVDANTGATIPKQTLRADDPLAGVGKEILIRKFNRADGCESQEVNGNAVFVCDKNHDKKYNPWTLYPWIADKGVNAGMNGCSGAADTSVINYATVLNADGTYTGSTVCMNGAISSTIPS